MGPVDWLCLAAVTIALTQAKIEEVKVGFQCPKNFPCKCEETKPSETEDAINLVNCHGKGLSRVPDFTRINSRDTVAIDLSNNSIRSVPKGRFKGLRIKWIKFNNNPMKGGMHEKTFIEADEVVSVFCRNCSLPNVPRIFKNTDGLEVLDLTTNNISKIEAGTFREAQLKELYVGANVFFPSAHMFVDLADTLERLSLYRSFLFNIPDDAVTKLTNLRRLDLEHNMIGKIYKKQMAAMPRNVSYIDLSNNPVREIEYGSFEDFINNREGVTINLEKTKIGRVNFIQDACRLNKAHLPMRDAPLVCDCDLYNITRDHVLNTTGYCAEPAKFKWYSIYGDNSFVSNTYEVEGEACPNVWKLPCSSTSLRAIVPTVVLSLLVVRLLQN